MDIHRKRDVLSLWMLCGNPWASSLEIDLARGSSEDHHHMPSIELDETRTLESLGLMTFRQHDGNNFWLREYKVSKAGRKWLSTPPVQRDPDDDLVPPQLDVEDPEIDPETGLRYCTACGGDGVGDDNEVCEHCGGTGAEPEPKPRRRLVVRRKT